MASQSEKLDFKNDRLTIREITQNGYTLRQSGILYWYEKVDEEGVLVDKVYLPEWVCGLLSKTAKESRLQVQSQIRATIGITT
ncbi:MAG: hypothetical protein AAGJ40_09215 [Planctomycetota bacterium]